MAIMTLQWNPATVAPAASQHGFMIQAGGGDGEPSVSLETTDLNGLDETETIALIAALQATLTTYGFPYANAYTSTDEQSELVDL